MISHYLVVHDLERSEWIDIERHKDNIHEERIYCIVEFYISDAPKMIDINTNSNQSIKNYFVKITLTNRNNFEPEVADEVLPHHVQNGKNFQIHKSLFAWMICIKLF